ncbi:MAG: S8 family serine peptidase [Halanaerobacter sp.]
MVKIRRKYLISSIFLIIILFLTACSGGGGSDTPTYYNLTVSTEGDGSVSPRSEEYEADEELQLEADADEGWEFKEWQGGIDSTDNPYTLVMDDDYTVTAVFEESQVLYDLTVNVEGQGSVTPQSGEYEVNEDVQLEASAADGWIFKEWEGIDSTDNPYTLSMDNNYTITAVFEEVIDSSLTGEVNISNKTASSAVSSTEISSMNQLNTEFETKQAPKMAAKSKQKRRNYKKEEIIIKYKSSVAVQSLKSLEKENDLKQLNKLSAEERVVHYRLPKKMSVEEAVERYEKLSSVEYAQPNYIYQATKIPNDEYYESNYQWAPINLNLEAAWDIETGSSKEINVAVIDTGIIPNHPDLHEQVSADGYDFVDGDDDPYDENDDQSHGTHVAGIIGAMTNNKQGIAGANWNVNLIPIRVLGTSGTGSSEGFMKGIKYAAGLPVETADGREIQLDEEVDIINMSLGGSIAAGTNYDIAMKEAINEATSQGVLVFAASGNAGDDSVFEPASYEDTIAVGAVGPDNSKSDYSNYGPNLDLVAPGGIESTNINPSNSILSTMGADNSNSYGLMSGTSMATPYASGVASLLLAQGVDTSEVEAQLKNTAVDLGPTGYDDEYGAGLIDAYGALLDKKLAPPKIFAATKNGNTLTVASEVREAANGEDYALNQINKGEEVYIIGWRDVNNDGEVNQGDYYGQIGPIFADDSTQINDLQLNYIGASTDDLPEIQGMD